MALSLFERMTDKCIEYKADKTTNGGGTTTTSTHNNSCGNGYEDYERTKQTLQLLIAHIFWFECNSVAVLKALCRICVQLATEEGANNSTLYIPEDHILAQYVRILL